MFLCTEKLIHLFILMVQQFVVTTNEVCYSLVKKKQRNVQLSKGMSVLPVCNQQHVGKIVVPVLAVLYAAMALASVSIFLLISYPSDLHHDPSWHLFIVVSLLKGSKLVR